MNREYKRIANCARFQQMCAGTDSGVSRDAIRETALKRYVIAASPNILVFVKTITEFVSRVSVTPGCPPRSAFDKDRLRLGVDVLIVVYPKLIPISNITSSSIKSVD